MNVFVRPLRSWSADIESPFIAHAMPVLGCAPDNPLKREKALYPTHGALANQTGLFAVQALKGRAAA